MLILKNVQEVIQTWDLKVIERLSAIRFHVKESNKYYQFYFLYKRDAVLPLDIMLKPRIS